MRTLIAALTAGALAAGAAATQEVGPRGQDTKAAQSAAVSTEDFIEKTAVANLFEIESSELAVESAERDEVRAFAEQMIEDHTKAGEAFKEALSESGRTPPAEELDETHQAKLEELKTADDFDAAYVDMQVQAHDEAVTLFSTYAESGDDEALRMFAETTLPVLEDHQRMIKDIADETGAGGPADR